MSIQQAASSDDRLRLLRRQQQPQGASTCRNIGLASATGKYIVFLDSDDILADDCLATRISAFETMPAVDAVVSQGLIFRTSPGDQQLLWNSCDFDGTSLINRFLNQDMPWQTTGATWRTDTLRRIGGWKEQLCCFQDWELHTRACAVGMKFAFLTIPDFFIRRSDTVSRISGSHSETLHVLSRMTAFESVIDLLARQGKLRGPTRLAARGFLLRNYLGLRDIGLHTVAESCLETSSARLLLSWLDIILLRWISSKGASWHWNRRVTFIADLIWRNVPYDHVKMQNGFMQTTYSGLMPSVVGATMSISK